MATEMIMPKLGMTMQEGTIIRWFKDEGAWVEKGEPILEIMTDKAVMEVEAPASGILAGIQAQPDDVIPVNQVIAYILEPGEKLEDVVKAAVPPHPEEVPVSQKRSARARVAATPAARRLAGKHGIDLAQVKGSGPGGRIRESDVRAFIEEQRARRPPIAVKERLPLIGRRKIIAERMQRSAQQAPHITLTVEVDMSEADRARRGCSFTALIVRAVAQALRRHPMLNASLQGDEIVVYDEVNIGVAVDTDEGVIVPVVKEADAKGLFEIDAELKRLAQRARQGKLTLEELSGGTFTVSNLGMFGVDEFHAIINPPQSAILTVGAIAEKPLAGDGRVVIRPMMRMSISADHRVLDGAAAAQFLQDVKASLEKPAEEIEVREPARIVVIGGGFGGYAAALRAAQLGAEVALIEKDKLGGTCLNVGCIPTKVLLEGARCLMGLRTMEEHGIELGDFSLDLVTLRERKDRIVHQLARGIKRQLDENGVRVLRGVASLVTPHRVRVRLDDGGSKEIEATGVIVATGSMPASISGLESALTSMEVLSLQEMPRSLIIVGGGFIGVEFACFFSALGTEVTVVEALPRILPAEDKDISQGMAWLLQRRGIKILTDSRVEGMSGEEVVVKTRKGERRLRAERVLVAVGRIPYTEGLNLEALGVKTERGAVVVNERMETSVRGIYAVGDVTGKYFLAHVASRQGEVAAENAVGRFGQMDYTVVPRCIFTIPEMAGVGLTEEEAKEEGLDYQVARFPLSASGRALTMGRTTGLVKLICERGTGRVLGLHIMGPHASELVAEGALAIKLGATARDLAQTIHAHPTLSEAIMEAAKVAAFGEAIHYRKMR